MALTIARLKTLCDGEGLKYFVAPDRPTVLLGFGGLNGKYQVVVPLELDGRFLQLRTMGYLRCPADNPHLPAVLKILGELNYRMRMTKFGWDPTDGEIVAYADVWLEDGDLTQQQFGALFRSLIPTIDLNYPRLTQAIHTGNDPGMQIPSPIGGDSQLPPEVKSLLDKLRAKAGKGKDKQPTGTSSPFGRV
jgi:hypothetical protein